MDFDVSRSNRITLTWLGAEQYLIHLGELFDDWSNVRLAFVCNQNQLARLSQHLFELSQSQVDSTLKTKINLKEFSDHVIPPDSYFCLAIASCGTVSQLMDRYLLRVKKGEVNAQPRISLWFEPPTDLSG